MFPWIIRKAKTMTETRGRVFDEIGRLMTDAAGAASGLRREVETVVRQQASRILADLDLVRRDEFETVRAMAERARTENERLESRIAALEERLAAAPPHVASEDHPGNPPVL
jgi:BMFP domain-containing protein YqiC